MKAASTMTPEKRARYAEWLRKSGVEHPSDELINQTQKRALVEIDQAKNKVRRYNFKLIALILCSLAGAVYIFYKL